MSDPNKMKAIYLVKNGQPESAFEIRETNRPEPATDEVLIKVSYSGLNYADVMARNGLYREAPPKPCVLGYDVVGVVEKVGKPEDQHLEGKQVVAFTRFGGYSEYVTTKRTGIAVLPDGIDPAAATALATQYCTAYYAACEMVRLHKGDKVLIHAAAGGVGIALTQLAKHAGCEIYGTASAPKKLEFMQKNGVNHPVNYRQVDYEKEIESLLDGDRLDVAFNAIAGATFKKDGRLIGSAGRQVLYGGADRSNGKFGLLSTIGFVWKMGLIIPIGLMMRSKGIIGVNMLKVGDNKPHILQRCMEAVVSMADVGILKPHLYQCYKAENVGDAHKALENRASIGKIALEW